MPRLQILELPEGADDDRPPFILVIDQVASPETLVNEDQQEVFRDQVGARAVLVFKDTIEIPANYFTAYREDGETVDTVRIRVEPDLSGWDEAIAQGIERVHNAVGKHLTLKLGDREVGTQSVNQEPR